MVADQVWSRKRSGVGNARLTQRQERRPVGEVDAAGCGSWSCVQVRVVEALVLAAADPGLEGRGLQLAERAPRAPPARPARTGRRRAARPRRRAVTLAPSDRGRLPARRARRCGRPVRARSETFFFMRTARACTARVARVPVLDLRRRRRRDVERRLDRSPPELVGEDRPRERAGHLRLRERGEVRAARRRGSGRGPPRRSAGRSRVRVDGLRARRAPRAGTRPRTRRRGRRSRALSAARSRRLQRRLAEQADRARAAASRRRRATGRAAMPASAGASQSEWSRVQSYVHATIGLSGSLPARVERRPAPRPDRRRRAARTATCFAASASHLTTSSHLPSGCRPSRPPAFARRAELQHHPEPVRRDPDLDQVLHARRASSPRRRRLPSDGALLRDRRAAEVDLGDEVGDLRRLPPPVVRGLVVRVRPLRAAAGTAARRARRDAARARARWRGTAPSSASTASAGCAPASSFTAISGWRSPTTRRRCRRACRRAPRSTDGSAGFDGVPTRLLR